jgi:hypothetical protein
MGSKSTEEITLLELITKAGQNYATYYSRCLLE